jgi:hypothetical protein
MTPNTYPTSTRQAASSQPDVCLTTRNGVLYDGDRVLGVHEADARARAAGFMYAEQLVKYLESRTA